MPSFDEPEFVERLRARDPEALRDIVHEYLPQCIRAARGAGLTAEEAEDVAQSAFITFLEKIEAFEGRSRVRTWLFGILFNKISEARRKLGRERDVDQIDEVMESRYARNGHWSTPPRSAETLVLAKEMMSHLEECLDETPGPQRAAFVLREVEGLATDEICKILEVSTTNLGVMMYRARNRLRECLEQKGSA